MSDDRRPDRSDARISRIVNAVLYEGYMLYPYRASSVKNRQRWNFGVVVPEEYHRLVDATERSVVKTECLLEAGDDTAIDIRVRFLQLLQRKVGAGKAGAAAGESLEDCDETIEREVIVPAVHPLAMNGDLRTPFEFAASSDEDDSIVRSTEALRGEIAVETISVGNGAVRIAVSIANRTPFEAGESTRRDDALRHSLLSAHVVLTARHGAFVSLLDPGELFRDAAAQCRQEGLYPVLAGEEGDRQSVLASPIILYDHPQVAPESPGDLFDGTEIDEILTLRIQTLSDEEKNEIRSGDARTRQLLERADNLEPEILARLHGALRNTAPTMTNALAAETSDDPSPIVASAAPWDPFAPSGVESVNVFGHELRRGDRVRLWPQKTADIMDLALTGRAAIIEAIEQDLEDRVMLAVVVDDDPGADMGMLRQPGHRFFFSPEEVEPLAMDAAAKVDAAEERS